MMRVRSVGLLADNNRNSKKKGQHATDLIGMNQHHESISLTAGVFLIDEKIMDQLRSIWDEMLKVPKNK